MDKKPNTRHHSFISIATPEDVQIVKDYCKGKCKGCYVGKRCTRVLTYGNMYADYPMNWTDAEVRMVYENIKKANDAYNRRKFRERKEKYRIVGDRK